MTPPQRPQGVQITHHNGTTTLCELAYQGTDHEGLHTWTVLTPIAPRDTLHVDVIPPRTRIVFPTRPTSPIARLWARIRP